MKCPICDESLKEITNMPHSIWESKFKCPNDHFSIRYMRGFLRYNIDGVDIGYSEYNRPDTIEKIQQKIMELIRQYKQPQKVRRLE